MRKLYNLMIFKSSLVSGCTVYVLLCIVISATVINDDKYVADKMRIRLYRNGINTQFEEFLINDGIQKLETSPDFNNTKPLVLVLHGGNSGANKRLFRAIVDSFGTSGKSNNYNILAMHMPELFKNSWENTFYFGVISRTEVVGRIIGDFFRDMIRRGLTDPSRINMIGYCLGSHVAAYAARQVGEEYRTPVEYIAGLDPVGIGYELITGTKTLNADDARIVHQFHANSYYFSANLGTADFIFNNGFLQPGCGFVSGRYGCSHAHAVWYFAESVIDGEAFEARSCSNIGAFTACLCNERETKKISFPPDDSASGKYFMQTRDENPHGMGAPGAICPMRTFWNWLWNIPPSDV